MQLIDGKATAAKIKEEIAAEVKDIMAKGGKQPHLAAILVGHDGGSETYVKNKVLACEACGFKSSLIRFEENVSEEELLDTVKKLNDDADVDGVHSFLTFFFSQCFKVYPNSVNTISFSNQSNFFFISNIH